MIIRGNTVGAPSPRADYAQEDPTAADYIKNKPDEAIRRAQETADLALEAVDSAKSELKSHTDAAKAAANAYTDAAKAEANAYTDDTCAALKTACVTLSLPASGWVGDAAPYTQTIAVDGLTEGKRVMVCPDYGDDTGANLSMRKACALVSYAKRDGGNITFTCLEDKPGTDIHIVAEVYV